MSVTRAFKFGSTIYSVGVDGTISTLDGKALTYQKDGDKRRVVLTDGDTKAKVAVHRIMAVVFLGATPYDEVGHNNKDGSNNALSNIAILKTHSHIVAKDVIEPIAEINQLAEVSSVAPTVELNTATLPTLAELLDADPAHAGRPYNTIYGDPRETLEEMGAGKILNISSFDTSDPSKPRSDEGGTTYESGLKALSTKTADTEVTVSNGYGTFPVTMSEFNSNSYYAKHGFKIVRDKAVTGLAKG